ncbi:hypothetical protein TcCL_NonESM01329, partial [Trypanosoma cruzi]
EGCPGGKERRADRVTGARRCGKDSIPGVDPDIVPRVAALRTGAMRRLPTLRQACTRPADHKQPIMSVVPFIPHTQEEGLLRPPPEPPPGVSAALPRRKTSSRSASSCPSCGSVFSSAHHMKAHARRTNPGTPIVAKGLTCGFCDSSTVSQQVPHAQVTTENVKRINEQKTDDAPLQAPMTAVALQPLLCCNPHQPLSPRQSTGGPAAHAVGMPPSSTTEHSNPLRKSISHDSVIRDGKVGHVSTESPQAINE